MSDKLILVSHSSTSATNTAAFACDEPLDDRGAQWAAEAAVSVPRAARVLSSPAVSCRQTAQALGLAAVVGPAPADWDLGRWRGRTLDEVATEEPDAVRAWLTDVTVAPHGGESLAELSSRVIHWLDSACCDGHTVAVTHAAVVRVVVLAVLDAPLSAFWRIDVAPLTATVVGGRPGRWRLVATASHLRVRR
ncbi:phosphoglycerate mutase family protein [Pseudonocardia sp. KRD-182]|uniref:histidine phosphatase family protein n=1 Tax=Pseudonocardia oceani TaxID=2792013 RepID=UPI001C49DD00|nr:phosphoglycerate mutase family protein [Pseudonocardia oceani]MBW0107676.1 phosphoglycerate mutase family protein [Pseudonocardia oceani]